MMNIQYKFLLLAFAAITEPSVVSAQYFHKDLWTQNQLNKEFSIIKNEKLRTITVKSFEDDGSASEGFFLQRKIDKDFRISQTISRSAFTPESVLTSNIDENGRVVKTTDSSQNSIGISNYTYDAKGRIISVITNTRATGDSVSITEERIYSYNEKGQPTKMLRSKNGKQINEITFIPDEAGNVAEEVDKSGQKYYYYYDTKNRLTDVVRYNAVAKRLLPDYMFSYSSGGNITQQVSVTEGTGNYFIWKYTYNEYGLKETEKVYSKERRLLGTIEYTYK